MSFEKREINKIWQEEDFLIALYLMREIPLSVDFEETNFILIKVDKTLLTSDIICGHEYIKVEESHKKDVNWIGTGNLKVDIKKCFY